MKCRKVTFSTGKSIVLRIPTMRDHRVSTKDLESKSSNAAPSNVIENLLSFIIVKAFDKEGVEILLGQPPINIEKLLEFQEYYELMVEVNEKSLLFDIKKKAAVEEIEFSSTSSPTKT